MRRVLSATNMRPLPWLLTFLSILNISFAQGEAIPVKIKPDGTWQRGEQSYFIKGAGGSGSLHELKRRGGNSIRSWSETELGGAHGLLERAQALDLTVCAGIWLEPECNWFSYRKPADCAKQLQRVLKIVEQHRNHPALLCWGLGNEAEGDGGNEAFWKQLESLATAVKVADPNHPSFTAVAGFSPAKIQAVKALVPSLDFVGINTYGALAGLRASLKEHDWTRPWVVTEYGARGFWESPRTPWGSAKEQTSTEKARQLREVAPQALAATGGCGGGYVFVWGWKQEATSTWFSLFSPEHESVGSVDVLETLWTGNAPTNQAPELLQLTSTAAEAALLPGSVFSAKAEAKDPESDPLTYTWVVRPEATNKNNEGKDPLPPPDLASIVKQEGSRVELVAPSKPGAWRLFLTVRDGKGHIATGNVPFLVKQ
jgi:hypothetical protein